MNQPTTFKEKIANDLDEITEGIFIGYGKPNPENGDRRPVIFIPHTQDAVSKLGLIRFAQMIIESDANNQIGFNAEALRIRNEVMAAQMSRAKMSVVKNETPQT